MCREPEKARWHSRTHTPAGNVLGSLIGGRAIDSLGILHMLHINIAIAAAGMALAVLSGWMSKNRE